MMMNAKHRPKSCGCKGCRFGARSATGKFIRRNEERSFRHRAKELLKRGEEDIILILTGTYTD